MTAVSHNAHVLRVGRAWAVNILIVLEIQTVTLTIVQTVHVMDLTLHQYAGK